MVWCRSVRLPSGYRKELSRFEIWRTSHPTVVGTRHGSVGRCFLSPYRSVGWCRSPSAGGFIGGLGIRLGAQFVCEKMPWLLVSLRQHGFFVLVVLVFSLFVAVVWRNCCNVFQSRYLIFRDKSEYNHYQVRKVTYRHVFAKCCKE